MAVIPYTDDELRERLRTLENGMLQVAKGITFADRGVQYNTAAELRERIEYFTGLLAQSVSTSTVPRRSKQTFGVSNKGF